MEVIAPKKQNIIMDATTLSTLMSCGRLTDFRFNHHFESTSGKSNSLEVGSVVHAALEAYYKAIIQGLRRDQAVGYGMAAGELYVRGCEKCKDFTPTEEIRTPECGHEPDQYPGVENTPPESTSTPNRVGWQDALDTAENYFDYYKSDFWVPLKAEEVVGKVLYEDDDIRILWKAKLDLLVDTNDGIMPMDHKTMKQRRETVSLNNQFIGQCLVSGTRQMVVNKIGFQKTLKPAEKFTRSIVTYTPERLLEWQSEILPFWAYTMLQYHESGYWAPNFNHCDNKFGACIFKQVCEANPAMREEELRLGFKIGKPWDPTNSDSGE